MLIDEEFLLRTNIERCLIVIQRLFPPETHSDDDDVALLWDTIHELKKKITKVERYEAAKAPDQPVPVSLEKLAFVAMEKDFEVFPRLKSHQTDHTLGQRYKLIVAAVLDAAEVPYVD